MIIDITYAASVASCPTEAAFKACVAGVVKFYEAEFNDPITINLDVGWGEIDGQAMAADGLGESESSRDVGPFTYGQVRAALLAMPETPATIAAAASLPITDPTGGKSLYMSPAEAKALDLMGANPAVDGYVGIGSGFTYAFPTSNNSAAPASADYNCFSILAHEISEDMGRLSLYKPQAGDPPNGYLSPLDIFDYAGKGQRTFLNANVSQHYFSIDGGATNLKNWNTLDGADWADWAVNGSSTDAFDAFGFPGQTSPVTAVDLELMNVLGYNPMPSFVARLTLVGAVAEPIVTVIGGGATPSNTGIFLSTSSTVTTASRLVGNIATGPIAEGASSQVTRALDLSGVARGTYYLAAIADYDGKVIQSVHAYDTSAAIEITVIDQSTLAAVAGESGVTAIFPGSLNLSSPLILNASLGATGPLTVSSTVSGAGTLAFSGTTTLGSGAGLTVAHIAEVPGDAAEFQESLAYGGQLTQSGGTLTVDSGDQLSLSGTGDLIAGTLAGAGTVAFAGGTVIFANAALDAGKVEIDGASAILTGTTSYSSLSIASSVELEGSLTVGAGGAFSILAGGDLIDTPKGNLVLDGPVAIAGILMLDRNYNLATTVSGAGEIGLAGGTITFSPGVQLTASEIAEYGAASAEVVVPSLVYDGRLVQTGGLLGVASGDALTLGGKGNLLSGTLAGPGTVSFLAGSDEFSGATLTAPTTINGAAALFIGQDTVTRSLTIDSAATVNGTLTAFGTLVLASGLNGAGAVTLESGTLVAGVGAALGVRTVNQDFGGVLQVQEASLVFRGVLNGFGGALSVASGDTLTLTGAGDILANGLSGSGTILLAAGSDTINNATVALAKLEIDGAATTISGFTSLSGGLDAVTGATITGTLQASGATAKLFGAGILTLSGAAITAANGATLTSTGNVEGAGSIGSGFVNGAGGLIEATASGGLALGASGSTFANAGTIGGGADPVTIEGAVANTGRLVSGSGALSVLGAVTGVGTVQIGGGGSAYFQGPFGENVAFTGSSGTLGLSQAYGGTISGFASSGSAGVDLEDLAFVQNSMTLKYSGTSAAGVLSVSNGAQSVTLHFSGDYRSASWVAISDTGASGGNTFIFSPGGGPAGLTAAMAAFAPSRLAHSTITAAAGNGDRLLSFPDDYRSASRAAISDTGASGGNTFILSPGGGPAGLAAAMAAFAPSRLAPSTITATAGDRLGSFQIAIPHAMA